MGNLNVRVLPKELEIPAIDVRDRIPEETISFIAREIAAHFRPKKIILFGTYAYGDPKPESDLDLLVILETDMRESQKALQIRKLLNPSFGIDIVVFTPGNLQKRLALGDSFLKEVVTKGRVLYESPDD